MSITINKTTAIENDHRQWVFMTIPVLGENYKYVYTAPKDLSDDALQSYIDGREDFYKKKVLRNLYPSADVYNSSLEDFEAWVSAGAENAEVSETQVKVHAVTAKDAVMGERQQTTTKSVEEEVSTTEIVKEGGKYVEKTTTETVTKQVAEGVTEEVDLYNEAGEKIGKHTVPVMESYEVSAAVEAVDEVTEEVVIKAAKTIEKKSWVDTH